MIDIENELFTYIAKELRKHFPKIYVVGEEIRGEPSFPCVSIIEMDNRTNSLSLDSSSKENHAYLMYEINIYSNKLKGKKSECKSIAKLIDEMLLQMNFTRRCLTPMANINNDTIYRIVGRYEATISKEKVIYRR